MPPIGVRGSLQERFWSRVNRSAPDQCWEWTAATNDRGYGQIGYGQTLFYAHRLSYEWHNDTRLSSEDVVRHTCDNPPCVNPSHLVVGTHLENMRDMIDRGRDRKALGVDNGRSKLLPEQVLEIDSLIREEVMSLRAIARRYHVTVNTIIALRDGRTWAHVTGRPT